MLRETTSRGLCGSVNHALVNTGGKGDCVKEGGGEDGLQHMTAAASTIPPLSVLRGSVHWGCDYATDLNIEVDPQRRRFVTTGSEIELKKKGFRYF